MHSIVKKNFDNGCKYNVYSVFDIWKGGEDMPIMDNPWKHYISDEHPEHIDVKKEQKERVILLIVALVFIGLLIVGLVVK